MWDDNDLTANASQYDLLALIQAFDEQNRENTAQDSPQAQWSITHAAMDALLSSSDDEALGGELAHAYGVQGALDPLAASSFSTLEDEQFGVAQQAFQVSARS